MIPDEEESGQLGRKGPSFVPGAVADTTFGGVAVASMSGGLYMSSVVTVDGVLWSCGYNNSGQLGVGDSDCRQTFVRVGGPEVFGDAGVRRVECGWEMCLILAHSGLVWVTGGISNTMVPDELCFPRLLKNGPSFRNGDIAAVGCGVMHFALVKQDGSLYTWGNGRYGALGHDDEFGLSTSLIVAKGRLGKARVGQWHRPDPDRALAFAMGNHRRLGHDTHYCHDAPEEVVRMMFGGLQFAPRPEAGPGLRILMGFPEFTGAGPT